MHKSVLFICLWAIAGSSYRSNASGFVLPHVHEPQNENVSLGASGDAMQSRLKIDSDARDTFQPETISKIENGPVYGADLSNDIVLEKVKRRLSSGVVLESLLRPSARNKVNEEINLYEHRKPEMALKSSEVLKIKPNRLSLEAKAFSGLGNTLLAEYKRKEWQRCHKAANLDSSYVRFQYRGMDLSYHNVSRSNVIVTLTIANVGDTQGSEVIECYVSWANKSLPVPREQLVYFDSIRLDVNQDVEYSFLLTWMSWAFWSNGTWAVQTGHVTLCCGDQQPQPVPTPNVLCTQFPVYA